MDRQSLGAVTRDTIRSGFRKAGLIETDADDSVTIATMSIAVPTRGEVGGSVAAHLQCQFCGSFSKSHAQELAHIAATHPTRLDCVSVGRLGNILLYQSTAQLFHCFDCFYTCRDFNKLYQHIITKHCMMEKGPAGSGDGEEGDRREQKVGEDEVQQQEEEEKEGSPINCAEDKGKEEEGDKTEGKTGEGEVGRENKEKDEGTDTQAMKSPKTTRDLRTSVLRFDGYYYGCMICGWKHQLKSVAASHVVRKHDIPKAYGAQAITQDAAIGQAQSRGAEEEDKVVLPNILRVRTKMQRREEKRQRVKQERGEGMPLKRKRSSEEEGKGDTGEEGEDIALKRNRSEEGEGKGEAGEDGEGKGEVGEDGEGIALKGIRGEEEEGKGEAGEEEEGKGEAGEEEEGKGEAGEEGEGKGQQERRGKAGEEGEGKGQAGEEGEGKGQAGEEGEGKAREENDERNDAQVTKSPNSKSTRDMRKSVLLFDGYCYCCTICGWKHQLKSVAVSHVVRKHDIPKAYGAQAITRDTASAAAALRQTQRGCAEEEEVLTGEMLKQEMEATSRVINYTSSRFVCLICGWKTKLKGFAINHVMRSHEVERPYRCKECRRAFFLPSRPCSSTSGRSTGPDATPAPSAASGLTTWEVSGGTAAAATPGGRRGEEEEEE
ncbi:spore wall protein 2-like [Thalassophryne amazonica]|uniref:spore wall protein 2-like n=1 Tax=Thalassophryne amazonica TaxID=390379 RepID=UPI0014724631|nr:spore wall protein 2-like [Thalassophryne amazonica]